MISNSDGLDQRGLLVVMPDTEMALAVESAYDAGASTGPLPTGTTLLRLVDIRTGEVVAEDTIDELVVQVAVVGETVIVGALDGTVLAYEVSGAP